MGNVRDFIDYMWVYVWLCARVCTHTCTCVCIHALMCPVWDGYTSQKWRWCTDDSVLWASIPCFCPCLFLSLSSVWEQDKISPVTLCLIDSRHWSPATMSSCSLEILSFPRDPVLLSVFFFLWTCNMSYLLPSCPAPPRPPPFSCSSSSSQLFLSDLWPHMTSCWPLGLLFSCHLIFPCSSLVQSSGDPLLLFKTALCVYYSLCMCMLHALLFQYLCVSVHVCTCVCVFQTYLFKVSQVKMTSYSRAWNLFILFLVFFQDYRE